MRMMKTEIIKSTNITAEIPLPNHVVALTRKLAAAKEVDYFVTGNYHLVTCLTPQELQELRAGLNDLNAKLIKMLEEFNEDPN